MTDGQSEACRANPIKPRPLVDWNAEPVTAEDDMKSAAMVVAMVLVAMSGALVGAVLTAAVMWLAMN